MSQNHNSGPGENAPTITISLETMASEANREHQLASEAACSALEHAARCGELLNKAKAELGHGNFLPWLKENFAGSERTAQNYMRLASNPQRAADLGCDSIRDAIDALTDRRSPLEKAAELWEEMADNAAKGQDVPFGEYERRCKWLNEVFATTDLDAMTTIREFAETSRLATRIQIAASALKLIWERRIGQIIIHLKEAYGMSEAQVVKLINGEMTEAQIMEMVAKTASAQVGAASTGEPEETAQFGPREA